MSRRDRRVLTEVSIPLHIPPGGAPILKVHGSTAAGARNLNGAGMGVRARSWEQTSGRPRLIARHDRPQARGEGMGWIGNLRETSRMTLGGARSRNAVARRKAPIPPTDRGA